MPPAVAVRAVDPARSDGSIARNHVFRWLLTGSSVSMLGSQVTTIAYPMLVLYLTGSPIDAAWVAFAATAPCILAYIPAGALVDRHNPWRVMLASEIGRGLVIAGVVAVVALGRPSIGWLVAAAVLEGILEVFSTLAEGRYVQSLVPRDQDTEAQVRIEARTHVVVLTGRPLGGLLFEITPILPFLADVASFAFSVGTLLRVRSEPATEWASLVARIKTVGRKRRIRKFCPYRQADRRLPKDIREGWRTFWDDKFVRLAMILLASTTLIFQAMMMIFLALAHARALSSFDAGTVLAASGLGGAFGSAAAVRLPRTISWLRIQLWCWAAAFAALVFLGCRSTWGIAAVMSILGFTGALGNIEFSTYMNSKVAGNMLARVSSISRLLSFIACAAGPLIGGFLFQQYRLSDILTGLFAATFLLAASSLSPSIGLARAEAVLRRRLTPERASYVEVQSSGPAAAS